MAEQLPDMLTPVFAVDIAKALTVAWRRYFGTHPMRESIVVLLAKTALETGRWKSCHCYNIGNIKSDGGKDERDWCMFACGEEVTAEKAAAMRAKDPGLVEYRGKPYEVNGVTMQSIWLKPPHPWTRFRAYRSIDEGALDYVATLRQRFDRAWPAVLAGDPSGFVRALKAQGYFTAKIEPYERAVCSLAREYSGLQFDVPIDPPVDPELRARLDALVYQSLTDLADPLRRRRVDEPA